MSFATLEVSHLSRKCHAKKPAKIGAVTLVTLVTLVLRFSLLEKILESRLRP